MKPYISEIVENTQYVAVVIGVSYESPMEFMAQIEGELLEKNVKGEVLFDMLLRNGNGKDRFLSICFNGTNFDAETAKPIIFERLSPLRKKTSEILCRYPDYIDNSSLNTVQRDLIRHGCVI